MRRTVGSVLVVAVGWVIPFLASALVSSDEPQFAAHSYKMRKLRDSKGGSRCAPSRITSSGDVVGVSDGKPACWSGSTPGDDVNALLLPTPDAASTGGATDGNELCILGSLTQNNQNHAVAWDRTKDGLPGMSLGPNGQET